jgi:hypothetical protein
MPLAALNAGGYDCIGQDRKTEKTDRIEKPQAFSAEK